VTIYLFHGENQPALRDALLELKKSYREAIFWEKELEELSAYLASPTLFSLPRRQAGLPAQAGGGAEKQELVIIEDPELGGLPELVDLARGGGKDIAFVFSEKIPPGKLPQGVTVRYFREEIPQNVFPFLDALTAKDKRKAFTEAHRLFKEGKDSHFLLAMVIWQLRNLARVKGGETKSLHPFVREKLTRLGKNFKEEDLSRAFSLLLKEDLAAKKGRAGSATFDFLIEKIISG